MVEKKEKKGKDKKAEQKSYTIYDLVNKFIGGINRPKNKR